MVVRKQKIQKMEKKVRTFSEPRRKLYFSFVCKRKFAFEKILCELKFGLSLAAKNIASLEIDGGGRAIFILLQYCRVLELYCSKNINPYKRFKINFFSL